MNIVNTLTLRHIKMHKKRTVLTVIAIIISVAMVTAVFTAALSFMNYFREVTLAVDGNQHVCFNIDDLGYKEIRDRIEDDNNIEKYGFSTYWTSISENLSDTMIIDACNEDLFDLRNVNISEGHFPQEKNEIVLTEKRAKDDFADAKPGDKITLNLSFDGSEEKKEYEFVVSGLIDSQVAQTDESSAYILLDEEISKDINGYQLYARYRNLNIGIYSAIEKTAENLGIDENRYTVNRDLLNYSGYPSEGDNEMILTIAVFVAILLLIIVIVSVFMIYDSFAVSYQERSKYLGILASVGAVNKQKRQSVFFEAFVLGLIGIPIGILSGIAGMAVTFKALQNEIKDTMSLTYIGELKVHINASVIVAIVIVGAITLLISAYIPAMRASRGSPIEAIRQADAAKVIKGKKLKVSKLTSKLFGFPGVMAVKNYKRNNKRSRNIVFTLFLSVIVFLSATNFSSMFTSMMKLELKATPDVIVNVKYEEYKMAAKEADKITNYTKRFDVLSDYFRIDEKYFKENKQEIVINFVDNKTLDEYASELGVKASSLHNGNKVSGILFNQAYNIIENKRVRLEPLKNIKGETVEADFYVGDTEEDEIHNTVPLEIAAQTVTPYSNEYFGLNETFFPVFVTSIDNMDKVYAVDGSIIRNFWADISIVTSDAESVSLELESYLKETNIAYVTNLVGVRLASINNLLKIAKVFAYGFIVLITLISVMNIINTISNSMNERRREFAMLRSVGMSGKEFKKMIYLELTRYGGLALVFGIPVSALIHVIEYFILASNFDTGFSINFLPYVAAVIAVFVVIFLALAVSFGKIKEDNIIDNLRE